MAIKNYTTQIDEHKTVAEIQSLLARKGASNIQIQYENFRPQAIAFTIKVGEMFFPFRLPCNFPGVLNAMANQYKDNWTAREKLKDAKFQERSRRVAWRIVKDWIDAQLAFVEAGNAQMAEVFFPYQINQEGQTAFQVFMEQQQRALPSPSEEHT
jgi:hypothetical protein